MFTQPQQPAPQDHSVASRPRKPVPIGTALVTALLALPALLVSVMLFPAQARAGKAPQSILQHTGTLLPVTANGYEVWQHSFFRIHFTRQGEDAVPAGDANNNTIPDVVEDVAMQLVATHRIYCEVLHFPSPLDSPWNKERKCIDVMLRAGTNVDSPENTLQQNGDAPVPCIILPSTLEPQNAPTAAREYFHQIQNGVTHIRNIWFYEGMAIWSERPFNPPPPETACKKRVHEVLQEFEGKLENTQFTLSAQAGSGFWHHLSRGCSSMKLDDKEPVLRLTYTNRKPVVTNEYLYSPSLIRAILLRLAATEHSGASPQQGATWTEEQQHSPENNQLVWQAVLHSIPATCPHP